MLMYFLYSVVAIACDVAVSATFVSCSSSDTALPSGSRALAWVASSDWVPVSCVPARCPGSVRVKAGPAMPANAWANGFRSFACQPGVFRLAMFCANTSWRRSVQARRCCARSKRGMLDGSMGTVCRAEVNVRLTGRLARPRRTDTSGWHAARTPSVLPGANTRVLLPGVLRPAGGARSNACHTQPAQPAAAAPQPLANDASEHHDALASTRQSYARPSPNAPRKGFGNTSRV